MANIPTLPTSNTPRDLKSRLAALSADEFEALQHALNFQSVRRISQSTGFINILLGGFTLWLGLNAMQPNTLSTVQVLLGALLIVVSLWAVTRPSLHVIGVYRWIFLIFGVCNLFIVVANLTILPIFPLVLGLLQIKWTFDYNRIFQENKASFKEENRPSPSLQSLVQEIQTRMPRLKSKTDQNLVDFQLGWRRWRGWLLGNYVFLFSSTWDKVYYFADKTTFALIPRTAVPQTAKRLAITSKIGDSHHYGVISGAAYERYAQWHGTDTIAAAPLNSPSSIRKILLRLPFSSMHPLLQVGLLVISSVVVFYICLFTVTLISFCSRGIC